MHPGDRQPGRNGLIEKTPPGLRRFFRIHIVGCTDFRARKLDSGCVEQIADHQQRISRINRMPRASSARIPGTTSSPKRKVRTRSP